MRLSVMKKLVLPTLAAIACAAAGCLPTTLNPLYTPQDLVIEPALVGSWSPEAGETWTFTKTDDKSYKLTITDKEGKTGHFEAHLLKLDGILFVDLYPVQAAVKESAGGVYELLLCRTHTFLKVAQLKPELRLINMNLEWLRGWLEKHPKDLPHHLMQDGLVLLTASTPELQAFVRKHLKTEGAWNQDLIKLERKAPKDQAPAGQK
jgi:hypothetical protein